MSPLVGARPLPLKDCDGWPLAHQQTPDTTEEAVASKTADWLAQLVRYQTLGR